MDIKTQYRYAATPQQLYDVRRVTLSDGRAVGTNLYQAFTAGGLDADILIDNGLDIGQVRFKGVNMSFLSKNGITSPFSHHPFEMDFLHSFPGGMLYTCGLQNAGPPSRDKGAYHPQHGRYHSIPAAHPSARIVGEGEGAMLVISGEVRESALFGPGLTLRRTITMPVFESEIQIQDTLVNTTPQPQEIMLLYHFNFGYPLLSEESTLILPEDIETTPRTEYAAKGLSAMQSFTKPIDGEEEQVFFHKPSFPQATASLINPTLGMAASLTWQTDALPLLIQWKSMASGDYALGLEPSNSYIMGREKERENGTLPVLGGFEKLQTVLRLSFREI